MRELPSDERDCGQEVYQDISNDSATQNNSIGYGRWLHEEILILDHRKVPNQSMMSVGKDVQEDNIDTPNNGNFVRRVLEKHNFKILLFILQKTYLNIFYIIPIRFYKDSH